MYRGGRLTKDKADLSPPQYGAEEVHVDQPCSTKTAVTTRVMQELSLLIAFTILLVPANLPSTM